MGLVYLVLYVIFMTRYICIIIIRSSFTIFDY